jgi:hypothetical protein
VLHVTPLPLNLAVYSPPEDCLGFTGIEALWALSCLRMSLSSGPKNFRSISHGAIYMPKKKKPKNLSLPNPYHVLSVVASCAAVIIAQSVLLLTQWRITTLATAGAVGSAPTDDSGQPATNATILASTVPVLGFVVVINLLV